MNQSFNLYVATETIVNDAQQLGVTVDELQRISINVSAQVIRQPSLYLQLTYQLTLPNQLLAKQLNWSMWQQSQVKFDDYLWEETCLECFIAGRLINDENLTDAQKATPISRLMPIQTVVMRYINLQAIVILRPYRQHPYMQLMDRRARLLIG